MHDSAEPRAPKPDAATSGYMRRIGPPQVSLSHIGNMLRSITLPPDDGSWLKAALATLKDAETRLATAGATAAPADAATLSALLAGEPMTDEERRGVEDEMATAAGVVARAAAIAGLTDNATARHYAALANALRDALALDDARRARAASAPATAAQEELAVRTLPASVKAMREA